MSLPKVLANFETSLASKISSTATTGILNTSTDDDGTTLSGDFILTIDEGQSTEEHILATLSGASITAMTRGLSRVDAKTSVAANKKEHGRGASVKITNMNLIKINRLINAEDEFDATNIMLYDAEPSFSSASNELCTVKYAEDLANAGAADASTVQKGIAEEATQAEIETGTATGGTSARLFVNPSTLAPVIQKGSFTFAADAEASDSYVISLTPTLRAYVIGQRVTFTANTANTGACTLNVDSLGAITIKKFNDQDLETGDIESGQVVDVIYDGTNFQLQTPLASNISTAVATEASTFFGSTDITGAEAETLTTKIDAEALHFHISPTYQRVSYQSTAGAFNGAATNTAGDVMVVAALGGAAAFEVQRYALDKVSGIWYKTHAISHSVVSGNVSSNDINGITIIGSYVYLSYQTNAPASYTIRFLLADLTGAATMTYSGGTPDSSDVNKVSYTDETDLYIHSTGTTWKHYTISGTTLTATADVTSIGTAVAAVGNGTNVFFNDGTTIGKYTFAGSSVSSLTRNQVGEGATSRGIGIAYTRTDVMWYFAGLSTNTLIAMPIATP